MEEKNNIFGVLFFYHFSDLEIPNDISNEELKHIGIDFCRETKWIFRGMRIFNNCASALDSYSNTPCPASQFIEAKTQKEFNDKVEKMKQNFKNETWLQENLYPYI